jgi:hypothetical protein
VKRGQPSNIKARNYENINTKEDQNKGDKISVPIELL